MKRIVMGIVLTVVFYFAVCFIAGAVAGAAAGAKAKNPQEASAAGARAGAAIVETYHVHMMIAAVAFGVLSQVIGARASRADEPMEIVDFEGNSMPTWANSRKSSHG